VKNIAVASDSGFVVDAIIYGNCVTSKHRDFLDIPDVFLYCRGTVPQRNRSTPMTLGSRIFLSFVVFLVSMIIFVAAGVILNSSDIHGPLVGDDYLTDWATWKYLAGIASAVVTLLSFRLFGRKKSGT
jgi:hypothetical protein